MNADDVRTLIESVGRLDARSSSRSFWMNRRSLLRDETGREVAGAHWVNRNDVMEMLQRWPVAVAVNADTLRKQAKELRETNGWEFIHPEKFDTALAQLLIATHQRGFDEAKELAAVKVADWYGHEEAEQANGVETEIRALEPSERIAALKQASGKG